MDLKNLLLYMFSSLFTQNNVAKGLRFTTALEKDKSIPEHCCNLILKENLFKML